MIKKEGVDISNAMLGSQQVQRIYLGSNIVWELPQQGMIYTRLEYISSDANGQYIDLGVKLYTTSTPNFDFEIKFKYKGTGKDNTTQATVFNTQLSDPSPWPGVFIRRSGNNVVARRGNNTTPTIGAVNTIITYNYDESLGYNTQNLTHNINASLFCVINPSGTPIRFSKCDLYYFKLWQNGVLTMDLIPCKDEDNVVGMYNTVDGTFFTSPNDVAFIEGPVYSGD